MKKNDVLIDVKNFHHIGIRVSDLQASEAFYQLLGFWRDPDECYPIYQAVGLVNRHNLRINLIGNAQKGSLYDQNILMDVEMKLSGFTHLALLVDNLDIAMCSIQEQEIAITEGPLMFKKRKFFFIRDPDSNVIEFVQII